MREGRPAFTYNYFATAYPTVVGEKKLSRGDHSVRYEFVYDGGGPGKGEPASSMLMTQRSQGPD